MRKKLEWLDVKLLRAILTFLDTQAWCPVTATGDFESDSSDDKLLSDIRAAVELITTTF